MDELFCNENLMIDESAIDEEMGNEADEQEHVISQSAILTPKSANSLEECPTTPTTSQRYSRFLMEFDGNTCKHCSFVTKGKSMRANNAQRHIKTCHPILFDSLINARQEIINFNDLKRNFVLYAATTTFPMHHVENPFLQKVIGHNNNLNLMTRKTLQKQIVLENRKLKSRISAILKNADAVSLSTDIMTTKGMRYSYLGLIAHAWYHLSWKSFAIGHVEMEENHNSGYIRQLCESIINEYQILPHKIIRVMTDSAANMKAAFINPFASFLDEENEAIVDNELCTANEMRKYSEVYDKNLELEDPQSAIPEMKCIIGHTKTHISCAAHRLQLVLKDVMETDTDALALKKVVFSILGKFMKSHNATRDLYLKCGKKLLFPANTRWSSLHITYERLLVVSSHVNKICKEKNWPELSDFHLQQIENICNLIAPFRGFTDKLQSNNIPTISLLYPGILMLIRSIEQSITSFPAIQQNLISKIRLRFKDVIESGSKSDSIFLVSAFLDPSVSAILRASDELEWLAKAEMKKMCSGFEDKVEIAEEIQSNSLLGFTVEMSTQTQRTTLEKEIELFFEDRTRPSFRSVTAAIYWSKNKAAFPTITILANQLFTVPATSASVERMFSQTTLQTTGHKSRSNRDTTNAKVLLSYNKQFIV